MARLKTIQMQIVHLMIKVKRRLVTIRATSFTKEKVFASHFAFSGLSPVQPPKRVELRRGRQVQHVLQLGHVADLHAIQDHHSLLHRVNRVAIEVSGPLLELGEILH